MKCENERHATEMVRGLKGFSEDRISTLRMFERLCNKFLHYIINVVFAYNEDEMLTPSLPRMFVCPSHLSNSNSASSGGHSS